MSKLVEFGRQERLGLYESDQKLLRARMGQPVREADGSVKSGA